MKREKIVRKLTEAVERDRRLYLSSEGIEEIATILSGEVPNPCPYDFSHTRGWCGNDGCRPGAEE